MRKNIYKIKTKVESKKKYRWILTLFAASSLVVAPIISLSSCYDSKTSGETTKLDSPTPKTSYSGDTDLTAWIETENVKDVAAKIADLFSDKTLTVDNTASITLTAVTEQVNQFKITVSLKPNFVINNQNSWTSTALTYTKAGDVPTKTTVSAPTPKTSYSGDTDLTAWINTENGKDVAAKIADLFSNKTLTVDNTASITLAVVTEQTNQFKITVSLKPNFVINDQNSWTSTALTYTKTTDVPTKTTIPAPTPKGNYSSNADLTAWINTENGKDVAAKIADLFSDKNLTVDNTASITLAAVTGQANQFKITVSLKPNFVINDQNSWTSEPQTYKDNTPKIEIEKPQLLGGDVLQNNLLPINEYVDTFNKSTDVQQKITTLFGAKSLLNTTTQSITVEKVANEKNDQIKFTITLSPGYVFKDSSTPVASNLTTLSATDSIICTYSRSISPDFTIGAYGDNDQTFIDNFNKLSDNAAKLKKINVPVLTANAAYIEDKDGIIAIHQENGEYGYKITLKSGCSFTKNTPASQLVNSSNATDPNNTYFFPFNGNGKVSNTIAAPVAVNTTLASKLNFDEYVNSVFPYTFVSSGDINTALNDIFVLGGITVYGLSNDEVSDIDLTKTPEESKFTFTIKLRDPFKWSNGTNSVDISFNYIREIQINPETLYSSVILSQNQKIDDFVTAFNGSDVQKQAEYLLRESSTSVFSKFEAKLSNNNQITFAGTVKDQFDLYGTKTYEFTCSAISFDAFKNLFDSIPKKDKTYVFDATEAINSASILDLSFEMLSAKLGWNETNKLLTPELKPLISIEWYNAKYIDRNSIQFRFNFANAYFDNNDVINLAPTITIKNIVNNVVNTFNAYTEEVNDIAMLVDTLIKEFVVAPTGKNYSAITLKTILANASDKLASFIVKYTPIVQSISTSSPITANVIQTLLVDILSNKSISEIMKLIFSAPNGTQNGDNTNQKVQVLFSVMDQTLKAIKQTKKLINDSPLPSSMKQPVNYVFSMLDGFDLPEIQKIADELKPIMPVIKFMLDTNSGVLDFLDSLISFTLDSGLIKQLLSSSQSNPNEEILVTSLQNIYNALYPFQPLTTKLTNYPTDPIKPTVSTVENNETAKNASVGFDVEKCALRNSVSATNFVSYFIDAFFNGDLLGAVFGTSKTIISSVGVQITPEIRQTLALAGIIINPSMDNKYVQFKLDSTNKDNPCISMVITSDQAGKTPVANNVPTYISLNYLTYSEDGKNTGGENWFGNANYQGGLFGLSLYDKLLGNKELTKALIGVAFSSNNPAASAPVTNLLQLVLANALPTMNLVDESTPGTLPPKIDIQAAITTLDNVIDKFEIYSEIDEEVKNPQTGASETQKVTVNNIYEMINALIGKIEQTASYQFAEKWIVDSSPYTLTHDQSTKQYIYNRTYNFGTDKQTNGITELTLIPLKRLLGNTFTVSDTVDIAKLFLENVKWIGLLNLLGGSYSVASFLYDKIVIPGNLSFTETLIMNASDILNTPQDNVNVNQTIDLTGMNELVDNVFGFNISGKNTNKNKILNWGLKEFLVNIALEGFLLTKDSKSYVFDINTKTLNIRFITPKN